MNRLHHLCKSLIRNIQDNLAYPNLEIILLDYNSKDNMDGWAKEHLEVFICSGMVTYYKTFQPNIFNHSHSKNMAFKLATGHIICNIDADNFVGFEFANYVNKKFEENRNIFLVPDSAIICNVYPSSAGRICLYKSDFLKVGGFDEKMSGYGYEDIDFINRLMIAGVKRELIEDLAFLKSIEHGDEERYDFKKMRSDIYAVYANANDYSRIEVYIFYKYYTYKKGTIVESGKHYLGENMDIDGIKNRTQSKLAETYWQKGQWTHEFWRFRLTDYSGGVQYMKEEKINGQKVLRDQITGVVFKHISDSELLDRLVYFDMEYGNRLVLVENSDTNRFNVNDGAFGNGYVFKNFDYDRQISV